MRGKWSRRRLAETDQLVFLRGVRDGDAEAFFECVDFIYGKLIELFDQAAGPADFDGIELSGGAETEVHAVMFVRLEARFAAFFVDEEARAGFHGDAAADGVAAGTVRPELRNQGDRSAYEAKGDPVIGVASIVDEQAGWAVHVADDGGEAAVVPQITDGQAPRRIHGGDAGGGIGGNVGEGAVTIVVIKDARFLESAAQMLAVDFRIDVAVDEEEIGPAVIVEVEEHGAPAEVFGVEAQAGGIGDVVESAVAVVAIESGGVVGEICFEDVELAVAVVIG